MFFKYLCVCVLCISFLKFMLHSALKLSTTLLLCLRFPFLLLTDNNFGSLSFHLYKPIFYFTIFICIYSLRTTLPWVLTHGNSSPYCINLFSFTIWEFEPLRIHIVSFLDTVQFMLQSILLFICIASLDLSHGGL